MFLPMNDMQFRFRGIRRRGMSSISLANLPEVPRQGASRALRQTDTKIGSFLRGMTRDPLSKIREDQE